MNIFLVLLLATREVVTLYVSDPIMLDRSIQLFRHLKHSNRIIFLVLLLATKEALALLVNDPIMSEKLILSFRHLEHQDQSIISEDIGKWMLDAKFVMEDGTWNMEQLRYYIGFYWSSVSVTHCLFFMYPNIILFQCLNTLASYFKCSSVPVS